jgi:hypothetical protein
MRRIKNDRLLLLKALRDHVEVSLENSEVESQFEADVAEMIMAMRDKRTVKQLKVVRKELDKWIKEMEEDRKLSEESVT